VLWRETRSVPEVSSPLFVNGRVYTLTNGGIVTCVEAASGRVLFRGRLGASGAYFASPVAATGYVYFSSGEGVVTVVKDAAESLQVVGQLNLGEPLFATPALCGNRIRGRRAGV
jgi:outer membrane protein assembly factor BamB